jgi:predicted aspartyl protease
VAIWRLDKHYLGRRHHHRPLGRLTLRSTVGNALIQVQFVQNSIVLPITVNGRELRVVVDSGDAVGPTFTEADAQALGLAKGAAEGIEGAGGASSVYETTATIQVGSLVFENEPSIIDGNLEGYSLLGWPFFAARVSVFEVDVTNASLILIGK